MQNGSLLEALKKVLHKFTFVRVDCSTRHSNDRLVHFQWNLLSICAASKCTHVQALLGKNIHINLDVLVQTLQMCHQMHTLKAIPLIPKITINVENKLVYAQISVQLHIINE